MNSEEIKRKIEELKNKKNLTAQEKIDLKKLEKALNKQESPVEASGVFVTDENNYDNSKVIYINTSKIAKNPYQPRKIFDEEKLKELSESIKTHGLIQPIVVADKDGGYILIAGERRLRAHMLANIENIKALVITDVDDLKIKELSILENTQRKDLNCIEEAIAYKELQDLYGYSIRNLEERLNKGRNYIHMRLQLTKFDDDCLDFILKQEINNVSKLLKILETEPTVHKTLLEKLANKELTDEEIDKFKVNSIEKLPDEKVKENIAQNSTLKDHDKFNDDDFSDEKKAAKVEAISEKLRDDNKDEQLNDEDIESTIIKETTAVKITGNKAKKVNISIDIENLTGKDLETLKEFVSSL